MGDPVFHSVCSGSKPVAVRWGDEEGGQGWTEPRALGKQRVHMLVILRPQLDAVDETFA